MFHFTEQCLKANMLPTWRSIALGHMRQLRMMIREGRQVNDARACLKDAQRRAVRSRRRWFAAADGAVA